MQNLSNLIRGIPYLRLAFFATIFAIAAVNYIQTKSVSATVEMILSILGMFKTKFPSGTAVMPDGMTVSTLKQPDNIIDPSNAGG